MTTGLTTIAALPIAGGRMSALTAERIDPPAALRVEPEVDDFKPCRSFFSGYQQHSQSLAQVVQRWL